MYLLNKMWTNKCIDALNNPNKISQIPYNAEKKWACWLIYLVILFVETIWITKKKCTIWKIALLNKRRKCCVCARNDISVLFGIISKL